MADVTTKIDVLSKELKQAQEAMRRLEVKRAELESSRKHLLDRLKNDFNVDSLEEAQERIEELGREIERLSNDVDQIKETLDEIMKVAE